MSILKDQILITVEDGLSYYNLVIKPNNAYVPDTGSPNTATTATAEDEAYQNEIVYNIYRYTKSFIDSMSYNLLDIDSEGTSRFNKNTIFSYMKDPKVINNFSERIFNIFLDRFDRSNIISDRQITESYVDAILNQLSLSGWITDNSEVVEEIIKYNLDGTFTLRFKNKTRDVANRDLEKTLENLLEIVYIYYEPTISRQTLQSLPIYVV